MRPCAATVKCHIVKQIIKPLFHFRKFFGPKVKNFFDPLLIMLTQMDFLKDMVLVVRMVTLLGGIVVFANPQLFSSTVSDLI